MRVWCQDKSKMTVYPYTQTSKKKTDLSSTALLRQIRTKDLHHYYGWDFLSFLLETHPARHTIQYFFLSAVILSEKKQSQKRAFKGK